MSHPHTHNVTSNIWLCFRFTFRTRLPYYQWSSLDWFGWINHISNHKQLDPLFHSYTARLSVSEQNLLKWKCVLNEYVIKLRTVERNLNVFWPVMFLPFNIGLTSPENDAVLTNSSAVCSRVSSDVNSKLPVAEGIHKIVFASTLGAA